MPADDGSILSEQIALLGSARNDPFWTGRLSGDDPVVGLGEAFVLNGLVTPTQTAATALIAREAADAVGDWLAGLLPVADDELYRNPTGRWSEDAPIVSVEALGTLVGASLHELPRAYREWRLTTEVYVLVGRSLYLLGNDFAARHKVLAEPELGIAFGGRLLPFLPSEQEEPSGLMLFVVSVPGRTAALGGLRGFRRSLLDGGQALAALRAAATPSEGRWWWETEFFDDACGRVLGVDGIERVPVAIGIHLASTDANDPPVARPNAEVA